MGIVDRKAREFHRREAEILNAAISLAGREDWQSITIDHIAERAEIGKGTVYKHFSSKDEVCARLVMDQAKELIGKLKAIDPGLEYVPRLKQVLKTVWHHNMGQKELSGLRQYCEASETTLNLSEGFAAEFWAVKGELMGFFKAILQEGIDRGIIASQPIDYLLSAGWSTFAGAMRLVNEQNFPGLCDSENYLDYLTDFVLKGLMNAHSPGRVN